ncbi:MAG TPA: ABC transporter permease [Pseudolabrys sp.]|nr:ABC transporter permease [Pseudolabrys sp.]
MTSVDAIAAESAAAAQPAGFAGFWAIFRRNPRGVIGLAVLTLFVLLAAAAPVIAPFGQKATGVGASFGAPDLVHLMGTDNLGRDVFSRFLGGCRISLLVGVAAAFASTVIGLLVGMTSGYFGGTIDNVLMRFTELFQTIPRFFLAMVAVALFGASIWNIVFAIAILSWPVTARLARAEYLSLRHREFADAARVIGVGTLGIMVIELLPNAAGPVIVNASLQVAQAILLEAGLSYLGLGDPGNASWGVMLYEAQPALRTAWWMSVFPGLGIFFVVLSLNLLGDAINDTLSPRSRAR